MHGLFFCSQSSIMNVSTCEPKPCGVSTTTIVMVPYHPLECEVLPRENHSSHTHTHLHMRVQVHTHTQMFAETETNFHVQKAEYG